MCWLLINIVIYLPSVFCWRNLYRRTTNILSCKLRASSAELEAFETLEECLWIPGICSEYHPFWSVELNLAKEINKYMCSLFDDQFLHSFAWNRSRTTCCNSVFLLTFYKKELVTHRTRLAFDRRSLLAIERLLQRAFATWLNQCRMVLPEVHSIFLPRVIQHIYFRVQRTA